ncbi:hypothetical protein [methane-oxidizing endosymbiont of Gigantopelta aegis]|uniref:hypothetical protein n=1 Tax=methane-oxidizing endosymbiont of Gigantopelta aegis TaxID=2794938 RepID=UPI0018DC9AB1|nr:hypothetical protein [methane-oxidizing endosymbiont of Gigantopelta aegis]
MDVSSVASTLVTPNTPVPTRTAEALEGNQPDTDGDRDDRVNAAAKTQKTPAVATGAVGSKLDVMA